MTTILQHPVAMNFIYPFVLMFFLLFAVLEKTQVLTKDNKQINALVSLVISLIFVGAVFPKEFASNMVLFLASALVVVFVIMLLWGFVFAKEDKGVEISDGVKWALFAVVTIALIIGTLWAAGVGGSEISSSLFGQSWSGTLWANIVFVILIAVTLAIVLKSSK